MSEQLVIVVDDDHAVRRALSRLLHSAGYTVKAFGSGQELLDSGADADCFVLDIHLGTMNGFELDERLRAAGSQSPIIFITAHDDEATRDRARRLQPQAYLRKPFPADALLAAVRAALATPPAAA
jgi:FixJ family two-component response regulator